MPGYVKVGFTSREDVEQRVRELDTTSVPLPFECYYAAEVEDNGKDVEKLLHDAFADNRVRSSREFFEIAPERVASALKIAEVRDVTPKGDLTETDEDKAALNEARTRRSATTFKMLDIPVGAILVFSKDQELTCEVIDNRRVLFEGEQMSVYESAKRILERMGYTWAAVNGHLFWEYEGETLAERRKRMETE